MKDAVSGEALNALVDGELAFPERERLLARLERDPELRREVAELRELRELMRHAYGARRQAQRAAARPPRSRAALAASLILAAGLALGWGLREQMYGAAQPGPAASAQRPLVLHLSTDDPGPLLAALDHAEIRLAAARAAGRAAPLEIVANGSGLDALRTDRSPYAARLSQLRARYPELTLVACRQTLDRLREKGREPPLLPGTRVASSALDQIVKRLQEGWGYLRV